MKTNIKNHKHTWIVASIAIILSIVTVIFLPKNQEYSLIFIGIAGSHILILLIVAFTGWIVVPQRFINKIWKRKITDGYDFGWSPKWLYSFLFASLIVLCLAVYLFFVLSGNMAVQFSVYTALLLFATNLFIGFIILQNSKRSAQLTLPMVTLLPDGTGTILDAGCGAGRTTIAIASALPYARIVAFDKFNADYIEGGGVGLLKKNIAIAGVSQRVSYETGDIVATSYENNSFDAIISSYMFDHLGPYKHKALAESFRILKPGGRFLLIVAIRSYSTFGIGNVLSLLFPTRATWKKWIVQAGFKMISDGKINEGAYFCFEKPRTI